MNKKIEYDVTELYHDMSKLFDVIKSSSTEKHLDVCMNMLHNLAKKWHLVKSNCTSPVYDSLFQAITKQRAELIDHDFNHGIIEPMKSESEQTHEQN